MKKSYKIILSVLISFVFVLSPILLAGCNSNASVKEISNVAVKAAEDYFDHHRKIEDFQDITLKWTSSSTNKGTDLLEYKLNAEDEEFVEGDFEYSETIVEEHKLSVKNTGETLYVELVSVSASTEHYFDVDVDDTLKEVTETEEYTYKYLAFQYEDEGDLKSILLKETTEILNGGDPYITKYMYELSNNEYASFIQEYVFGKVNKAMKNQFFELNGEIMIIYQALMNLQKNGNVFKTSISLDNMMYVDDSYNVVIMSSNTEIYFKNNKAWKAEGSQSSTMGDAQKYESKSTFVVDYSADVATVSDFTGYTANDYVKQNFRDELNDIYIVEPFGIS